MTETFTLYKLIILYLLNKVDFPLTTSQISEFILDKGYTTYFRIQEALSEMVDSNLLQIESGKNRTLYYLTEDGAQTIHYFKSHISSAIREDIDNFLAEKKYDLKEDVSAKADYHLNKNNEYEVRCRFVEDGFDLIDLTLTVPTEAEARAIAANWPVKYQQIYSSIMSELL